MPSVDTRPQYKVWPNLRPDPRELGLVAAYDLGKPVNDQIIDLVGPYNGTLNGGPIVESTPIGMGMCFDGVNDYANLFAGRISDSLQGYISCWIKPNVLASNYTLVGFGGSFAVNYGFFLLQILDGGGGIYYFACGQRSDGAAVVNRVRGGTALRINQQYHIALVSDGSVWSLYVDGRPETLTLISGANNGNWFGDTTVTAPSRTTLSGAFYSGAMVGTAYAPCTMLSPKISTVVPTDSDIRNEYLRGKAAMWRAGYGVGVSSADEGGTINDTLGRMSGADSGVRFASVGARWRFETDNINGQLNCKVIRNYVASGGLGINTAYLGQNTTEAAYGTWEIWMKKTVDAANQRFMFIGSVLGLYNDAAQNGYLIQFSGTERIALLRITGGAVAATLFETNINQVALDTWYKITVSRTSANIFTGYLNDTLIGNLSSGANPTAADGTHTTSSWMLPQIDGGIGGMFGWSGPVGYEQAFKKLVIAK